MKTRNTRTWKAVSVLVVLTVLISAGQFLGPAPVALASTTVTFYATNMDSYVQQNSAGTNYGDDTSLYVRSRSSGNRNWRTYVRFDLSSLPTGATIVSATLRLNITTAPSASRTYQVYRVTGNWAEGTITWANQPNVAGSPTASATIGSPTGWKEWDITSDVQAFYAGTATNYGWRIRDQTESSPTDYQGTFSSSETTGTITDPQLVVIYNRPPVAVDDSYGTPEDTPLTVAAPGVLANDSDADGDPLTAIREAGPASGTLVFNANGSFVYTPALNFNGVVTFTYHANDGTANSNTATVTVTVTAVNDAPVAVPDGGYGTPEDTPLTVAAPGVLANDSDADGNALTAIQEAGPASGTLVLNANGSFVYTPALNFNGVVTFTYHSNDGTANSNTATVTITVTAVNDAPVAVDDGYSTPEDTPLTVAAPGVLANDSDADGDPLTAIQEAGPASGTLVFNANGSFVYSPALNFNGVVTFTYHANDGTAGSNTATVTITVTALNDAPVAADDSYRTLRNTPLIATQGDIAVPGVLDNDSDADAGDALTAVREAGPASGTLVLDADGSFVYTPTLNFTGVVTFTYHANDGTTDSNTATVTITVTEFNYAPVAVDDSYSTPEDTPLTVAARGVLANDSDADGDALTAIQEAGPANGTLVLDADGSFVYTPALNFNGVVTFTYHANDGMANSNTARVIITITALNDAPTFTSTPVTNATEGVAYTYNVTAADVDNAVTDLTIAAPIRPGWLTLTDNGDGTATLTGIPTHTNIGDHPVVLQVSDGLATTTQPFTITVSAKGMYYVYLPVLFRNYVVAPDLVVQSLTATSGRVQMVIVNQGNAPVTDEFWVDVYIDPQPIPTGVNQIWPDYASQGLVWGVTADALPLAPGETLTLTIGDAYYSAGDSSFSGSLAEGTPVYAQVDSANSNTSYGGVLEDHEILGGSYNNIASTSSTAGSTGVAPSPTAREGAFDGLPPRK